MITAKQYKALLPYEDNLYNASQLSYVRFKSREDLKVLDEIYTEIIGEHSGYLNGCNRCVLTATKRLARLFYEYKKDKEEKAKIRKAKKEEEKNND